MAQAKSLSEMVGKEVCVVIDGSGTNYKVLALDTTCGFIKLKYAEGEGIEWHPLSRIEKIEEVE